MVGRAAARLVTALLAVAGDLALEVVCELVDRRPDVTGRLVRAQREALRKDRRLGDVLRLDRGFFSSVSSTSTSVFSGSCLASRASFFSAYSRIDGAISMFLPFT